MDDGLGWLTERQRDGGVDQVPLPAGVDGELWLCGKRAIAGRYGEGRWDAVVCLVERHEILGHHPEYVQWLETAGDGAIWAPVHDLHAPPLPTMQTITDRIVALLRAGARVVVHCAAGFGRSGTTAVCVLITLGLDADAALAAVAAARPGAGPEVGAQRDLVADFRAARSR